MLSFPPSFRKSYSKVFLFPGTLDLSCNLDVHLISPLGNLPFALANVDSSSAVIVLIFTTLVRASAAR